VKNFQKVSIFPESGLVTNQKIAIIGAVADREPLGDRPDTFNEIYMDHSHVTGRQHGLTLVQWAFLFVAFMLGVGGSFVVRGIFPPVHASVIQTATASSGAVR